MIFEAAWVMFFFARLWGMNCRAQRPNLRRRRYRAREAGSDSGQRIGNKSGLSGPDGASAPRPIEGFASVSLGGVAHHAAGRPPRDIYGVSQTAVQGQIPREEQA
jgi:hypothetical protein